jgi:hypothetical protein
MFCRLKDFRRIATRYDKLARYYLAAICLAAPLSGFVESTINFAVPTDLGKSLSTLTRPRRAHREIGVMSGRDLNTCSG